MVLFILLFIAYSVIVFLIDNIIALSCFTAVNIVLCFVFKTGFVRTLKNLYGIFWFALFVFLVNIIFDPIVSSLVVVWKIFIVANFTFIMSKAIKPAALASGFAQLFFPLKIFKVDTDALALVIVIALNFVPILSKSLKTLKSSLKARGFKITLKTLFTQGHIIFVLFFAELFKRAGQLEMAFKARGYKDS